MSKVVKIVLLAPGSAEAALEIGSDKKNFLETMIEDRDENINSGPGVSVFLPVNGFPRFPGLPAFPGPPGMIPVPISQPTTSKLAPEEAVKNAVYRKLREYNLNIDKSRLVIQTLTEQTKADGKFLYVALYKLSDTEKISLERRTMFSPFAPMINFFPITNLPIGLPYIDAGVARFITTRFDIIRDSFYLGDPRVIFPSTIVPYSAVYPFPYYSPYLYPQIVRNESTYMSPGSIFNTGEKERESERERRRGRSKSSSRSSSRSPRSRSSREKKNRDKYLKYKQKYLDLKAKIDKL